MHFKRLMSVMALTLAALASSLVVSQPASAADPTCNTASWVSGYNGGLLKMPTYNGNYQCKLNPSSSYGGDAVKELQSALSHCWAWGDPGINLVIDGYFGQSTKNALINVQQRWGILADGGYGAQSRETIGFVSQWGSDCWSMGNSLPGPYWY